ncbi:MAG TPA: hypothetical protein VFM15_02775 [Gammaproteobacteria bacterium]|nr:hypothetical protein [Gammaproteobacteria bacterium]
MEFAARIGYGLLTALIACAATGAPPLLAATSTVRDIPPTTTLLNPNGVNFDDFGASVALSDDGRVLLVGAPETIENTVSGGLAQVGRVYVFLRGDRHFDTRPARRLDDPDPVALDEFGARVALSENGRTALVSASGGDTGVARVFVFDSADGSLLATLESPDNGADCFGQSLALSATGDVALVSANCAEIAGLRWAGKVYVYARDGGGWSPTPLAVLTEPVPARNDFFGTGVALSDDGNTALIGSDNYSSDDPVGRAYVFTRSGGNWQPAPSGVLSDPEHTPGSMFGSTVALSGDGNTALVGAGNAGDGHAAHVFQRNQGQWSHAGALNAATDRIGTGFVNTVKMSTHGDTALVGRLTGTGVVQTFAHDGGGTWPQQTSHFMNNPTATNGDAYGWSAALSMDGRIRVVGAPYAVAQSAPAGSLFSAMPGPGRVYIYNLQEDGDTDTAGHAGASNGGVLLLLCVLSWLLRRRHRHGGFVL